jgi:hypothetical protein
MAKVKRFNKGEEVELSGAEEEYQKNPQQAREKAGRGFGADVTKPSPDEAEFMASEVTSSGKSAPAASKPKIVTKEELAAFQKENGADKTLRDYLNAQKGLTRRGESKSATSFTELEKNAPSGTSEAAMKALRANAAKEANQMADLEKGNSRGQKSMAAAPKITKGESRKPYNPGSVDNSYTGSKFAKGGITSKYMSFTKTGKPDGMKPVMARGGMARSSASKRGDGIATKGFTKGRNL